MIGGFPHTAATMEQTSLSAQLSWGGAFGSTPGYGEYGLWPKDSLWISHQMSNTFLTSCLSQDLHVSVVASAQGQASAEPVKSVDAG